MKAQLSITEQEFDTQIGSFAALDRLCTILGVIHVSVLASFLAHKPSLAYLNKKLRVKVGPLLPVADEALAKLHLTLACLSAQQANFVARRVTLYLHAKTLATVTDAQLLRNLLQWTDMPRMVDLLPTTRLKAFPVVKLSPVIDIEMLSLASNVVHAHMMGLLPQSYRDRLDLRPNYPALAILKTERSDPAFQVLVDAIEMALNVPEASVGSPPSGVNTLPHDILIEDGVP